MHALILLLISFARESGGGLTNSNIWQYTLAETLYHTAGHFGEVIIDPLPNYPLNYKQKINTLR